MVFRDRSNRSMCVYVCNTIWALFLVSYSNFNCLHDDHNIIIIIIIYVVVVVAVAVHISCPCLCPWE